MKRLGRPKEVTDEQIVVAARRCFIERGAGVSAAAIARELGVSHTTLFNRFGSKEALMIAALGPPEKVPWVAALEAGPDDRPVREQLVEHGKVMSAYFQKLQAGLAVLQAAGITLGKVWRGRKGEPPPVQAFRALTAWLWRAQSQGRLAKCDVETLASTILGALHNRAFTACVCGVSTTPDELYVERFIELLWNGIGGGKP
ncbi:MAG: TetR/AcrR family transcriptional regulator [Deltaproteobacteria bacterium]|nr:TetR/AcrR family transcriptional regulator [Deltaproteobacteria bacterium]